MVVVIKNGRVIDPASGVDAVLDVLVADGKIQKVGNSIEACAGAREIDARNCVVTPGLIDMHTHLREPGHEYKETIKTGAEAAAAGGVTSVACMANTCPVNDSASVTNYIVDKARREACVHVFPVGAVTLGLRGEHLTEIGDLKEAGCVAVSDDGTTIANARLMRLGLEYARNFDMPLIAHCQDPHLSDTGAMHEGAISTLLGLPGIPAAAEDIIVARDVALADWSGCPVHIAHVSTAGSVRIIREAKARGVAVTAETAPHYFCLTHAAVAGFDTSTKMFPPLRTEDDVRAVREGLNDGTIDAIASDHAPHSSLEKNVEFDRAAFGIVGLETLLPLSLSLVHDGTLTLPQLVDKLTAAPARILRLAKGTLREGTEADITIIDVSSEWTVDRNTFISKSRNTPFHGWSVRGRSLYTLVNGRVVFAARGAGESGRM
jgi:dihydroorotase